MITFPLTFFNIKAIAFRLCFVSINLSILYNTRINNINVISCALAAIYPFNKYFNNINDERFITNI